MRNRTSLHGLKYVVKYRRFGRKRFSKTCILSYKRPPRHISEHNSVLSYSCENPVPRVELLNSCWGRPETNALTLFSCFRYSTLIDLRVLSVGTAIHAQCLSHMIPLPWWRLYTVINNINVCVHGDTVSYQFQFHLSNINLVRKIFVCGWNLLGFPKRLKLAVQMAAVLVLLPLRR
jgi:hypothetical protein